MYNDQVVSLSGYNILYILFIWLILIKCLSTKEKIAIFIKYNMKWKLKKFYKKVQIKYHTINYFIYYITN